MNNFTKQEDQIDILYNKEIKDNNKNLMPSMNINANNPVEEKPEIIGDEKLLNIYEEIMNDLRDDRKEVSELLTDVVNLVVNEGDATSASKEAMVNLMKLKTEIADKKSKVADLMTRIKLKERDTFPKYLAAHQNNTIKIESSTENRKKEFLKIIEESKGKK